MLDFKSNPKDLVQRLLTNAYYLQCNGTVNTLP